jgi:hypothetical protein
VSIRLEFSAVGRGHQSWTKFATDNEHASAKFDKGTRVPVESLFTNLESGLSLDEYLDCFPDVTREQAVAVLEYAQKLTLQPAA